VARDSGKEVGERHLISRLLLDTHILIRVLHEPRKLSKKQERELNQAIGSGQLLNISAATFIEIASVFGRGSRRSSISAGTIFDAFGVAYGFNVIPVDLEIGREVADMGDALRDPMDRVIVATARVHRLRLVTSDQAIIDSNLVSVVE
jgi:PIN domain nuclease of toxin-antitoxin system